MLINSWNRRRRSADLVAAGDPVTVERSAFRSSTGREDRAVRTKRSSRAIQLLLLLPYLGLLWVPLYNQKDPVLLGFLFFYWYQLLWVPLTRPPHLGRLPEGLS